MLTNQFHFKETLRYGKPQNQCEITAFKFFSCSKNPDFCLHSAAGRLRSCSFLAGFGPFSAGGTM